MRWILYLWHLKVSQDFCITWKSDWKQPIIVVWFLIKRCKVGWSHTQQLVNSNLNLPQLLGHCAKFKPSLNPGTVPIEHLGLVDTDFELSHDIEQGFDYARLLPQLEFRLVKLCFLFLAKLIRVHTKHGNRYSHYLLNRYLYSWDDPL